MVQILRKQIGSLGCFTLLWINYILNFWYYCRKVILHMSPYLEIYHILWIFSQFIFFGVSLLAHIVTETSVQILDDNLSSYLMSSCGNNSLSLTITLLNLYSFMNCWLPYETFGRFSVTITHLFGHAPFSDVLKTLVFFFFFVISKYSVNSQQNNPFSAAFGKIEPTCQWFILLKGQFHSLNI